MDALSPEAIRLVDAIARHGSFAQAAREAGKVPSAVTYSIRKLEEQLDVLLFDRRGQRATLTPAGEVLLQEGRHLLLGLDELANRVKRVAHGWEVELRIAVDAIVAWGPLYDLIERFDALDAGTRLRFSAEVLQGTWDALVSGRADLAIGVSDEASSAAGFKARAMGQVPFVFCVAPHHPLARATEPLAPAELKHHRAAVVADSTRTLAPRTAGLVNGQPMLTLPTLQAKLEAQLRGLGCGYLPEPLARPHLDAGHLVQREVAGTRPAATVPYAWRHTLPGKAAAWWVQQPEDPRLQLALLRGGRV